MIKIAICDDVEADRYRLKKLLEHYFNCSGSDYKIAEYSCGENLVAEYEEGPAEFLLLFLDIYMGKLTGMDTARRIREIDQKVKIIFTSFSPDFAIQGYEVKAEAYLLKPVPAEKTGFLLGHILKDGWEEQRKSILLRSAGRKLNVYHREIVYAESMRRELLVHLTDGSCVRVYGKLDELESELNNVAFLRCHQSYLVNMHYIRAATDEFLTTTGAMLPIRKREQKAIKDTYYKYMVGMSLRGK